MRHTEKCLAGDQERSAEIREYLARWPRYCQTCHGWGYVGDPDEFGGDDFCSKCSERGICGRCGVQGLGEDYDGPCSACGWDYDSACPPPWEVCECDRLPENRADAEVSA